MLDGIPLIFIIYEKYEKHFENVTNIIEMLKLKCYSLAIKQLLSEICLI